MPSRSPLLLVRLSLCILLLTTAVGPFTSQPAQAAPPAQAGEPEATVMPALEAGPLSPAAPGDHLVTGVTLGPDTPNILAFNDHVDVTFGYSTTDTGGVRIFVRPYTSGAPTPNYAAHGSPLYPTSATGAGSGYFTITSGSVVVDQIRFTMYNADQSALLFEAFIPVHYLFGDPTNLVTHLDFTPDTPDVLALNQDLRFSFDYSTRQPGGVRIFARPFTNGALSPNYAAHGSPVHPIGGGSGTGFFTLTASQAVVDQVRIQMWDANQTTLLFEAFLPVYFRFRAASHLVTQIELSPDTPNLFKYGGNVNLTFNYTTNQPGGVRIWARPFSGPNLTPGYAAHGSPIYPAGSGNGTGSFNLTTGPMVVDKIRIQMWDANQTTLLFEAFLPVHLAWVGSGPPPGPDLHVNAIEVTQAIQDLNNSVDLVAGKRTYVRVHVSAPVNVNDVFDTLSGRRGFVSLTPVLNPGNPGSDITVRPSPDRGQLNDSFWFELPSSWATAGSLTLTARIDPNNAKNDLVLGDNVRTTTVTFQSPATLQLRIVNVQYTVGGTTYLAANSHLSSLESWLRRAYPISTLEVTRQTFVYPTAGLPNVDTLHGWLALGKIFRMLFSGEDARVVYYGVVDDGGGFMRGKAAGIPGTIAAGPSGNDDWGWDFDGSYNDWYGGHEIGHTRGRSHAEFCGAGGGAAYPYPSGRISPDLTGNGAIYGFDISTRAIYPPAWKDVMTYCSNQWVSDFTYEGIRNYLDSIGLARAAAGPASVSATEFLAVMGLADLDTGTASLESAYLVDQSADVPLPEPGDWTLALVDGADNDLATYAFAPELLSDAEDSPGTPAVIAEVIPWVDGAVRVEVRFGGAVVASRTASANAPTVVLTAPADGSVVPAGPFQVAWEGADVDGDPLEYSLLFSRDDGATWDSLGTGLTGDSVTLNTDDLPGGAIRLRVLVSDGFLSGQDTSEAVTLPLHAPTVTIAQPDPDAVFFPTQPVALQGSAYDMEDGTLADAAFAWSSDRDGGLGNGASLNTSELSTGTHLLTLTVTDSQGQTGTAQRTIVIAEESANEPLTLEAAPVGIGVVVALGGGAQEETLTLRTPGETELDWTVSENVPWLSVSTASGQTPTDLVVTLDPAQLPVGVHFGVITLTAEGAENSPLQVPVTLEITGYRLNLPAIWR